MVVVSVTVFCAPPPITTVDWLTCTTSPDTEAVNSSVSAAPPLFMIVMESDASSPQPPVSLRLPEVVTCGIGALTFTVNVDVAFLPSYSAFRVPV